MSGDQCPHGNFRRKTKKWNAKLGFKLANLSFERKKDRSTVDV
jgi:hypothetical protein